MKNSQISGVIGVTKEYDNLKIGTIQDKKSTDSDSSANTAEPVPVPKEMTTFSNFAIGPQSCTYQSRVMRKRWLKGLLNDDIPKIDIEDHFAKELGQHNLKQFWPEFSQTSYKVAFDLQETLKNYTSMKNSPISARQREGAVALIHDLHKDKKYKKETMFIAIGLLDRYLSRWIVTPSVD